MNNVKALHRAAVFEPQRLSDWWKDTNKWLKQTAQKQPVLVIAIIAMLVTCILVPVDAAYLDYFNWPTLATLYCTMAVVEALARIHVFEIVSRKIVIRLKNLRNAVLGLVFITFIGSMFLANDMALLTFLPLGYLVLSTTGNRQAMAFTFIMQNIAANLGGMVTPFGNPQNLYLYAYYHIDTLEFMQIMFPSFAASVLLMTLICCFIKAQPLTLRDDTPYRLDVKRTVVYGFLFLASILIVFRTVPYRFGTIIITGALLLLDRQALKGVNYGLLATFAVFFVFSGNMARIAAVNKLFSTLLPRNTLLFGILSCQLISNVPSAVLLSHFTDDYRALLPAVNIGGCGTLIASLASLITFSEFKKHNPQDTGHYLLKFTLINYSFVVVLYLLQTLLQ